MIMAVCHEGPLVRWEWRFRCKEERGWIWLRLQAVLKQTRQRPGCPWRTAWVDSIRELPPEALQSLIGRFRNVRLDQEQFDCFRRHFADRANRTRVDGAHQAVQHSPKRKKPKAPPRNKGYRSGRLIRAGGSSSGGTSSLVERWYRLGLQLAELSPPQRYAYAYRLGRRMAMLRARHPCP